MPAGRSLPRREPRVEEVGSREQAVVAQAVAQALSGGDLVIDLLGNFEQVRQRVALTHNDR
eukprot:12730678-Alexandrium_andersonii.AAC.1